MSPAVLFFVPTDLVESDLFRVLGAAPGWGVDCPDTFSSDALPLREIVEASFLNWVATVDFAVGLAAALVGTAAVGGGAYLAVRR